MVKLGRNESCWCRSGRKYKKCHLDRDKQQPVKPWEVDKDFRARSTSGACLHVGVTTGTTCGKPAIGSHTVTKAMLRRISRNGHVYWHSATIQDLEKTQGQLSVKPIGINAASVGPVFCQAHDNDTFAPLERAPFTGTLEQCFLLAYRALCHELAKKSGVLEFMPTMKTYDRGKPVPQQVDIQTMVDDLAGGSGTAVRDLNEHKRQFDSMLAAQDYADMHAYVVRFGNTPDILCAGALYPVCDFAGRPLQDFANLSKKMELITYSLTATESGGAFVFAWHSSGDAVCRPLAASLDAYTNDELPHAIVRFIYQYCENHYMKPDWWDNTAPADQKALTKRLQLAASPLAPQSSSCLADDGLRVVSWTITQRTWS